MAGLASPGICLFICMVLITKKWAIMRLKVSYTADKLIARTLMRRPLRFFLSF